MYNIYIPAVWRESDRCGGVVMVERAFDVLVGSDVMVLERARFV